MEQGLNEMAGRIKASRDGEWKRLLADRYWLQNALDEIEKIPACNYGPPAYAP